VREIMTEEIRYCYADQDLAEVSRNMAEIQLRRLPVVNREKQLVGIVALGDFATHEPDNAEEALSGISQPRRW
jgi:CBS domain-containing protein